MTHVSRVEVTESKVTVGQTVTVRIWVQSDYFDVGTPYDVQVFTSTSGNSGTWEAITSRPGWISWWGEFEIGSVNLSMGAAGVIYVGAKDKGESEPNNPNYFDTIEVIPPITPGYGYVVVKTVPSGASAYIDGIYKGVTPRSTEIAVGNHTLRVVKEGYKEISETITVVDQTITSRSFTLEKEDEIWGALLKYAPHIAVVAGIGILIWVVTTPRGKRTGEKVVKYISE